MSAGFMAKMFCVSFRKTLNEVNYSRLSLIREGGVKLDPNSVPINDTMHFASPPSPTVHIEGQSATVSQRPGPSPLNTDLQLVTHY